MQYREKYLCIKAMILLIATYSLVSAQVLDTIWTKTYGGIYGDFAYATQQTFDGGYMIAGYTGPSGAADRDIYLVKTDSAGDTIWTKTYEAHDDYCYSAQQTADSGYILVGYKWQADPYISDIYLIKTDSAGDTIWTKTYGYAAGADVGYSVQQTSDAGYFITGWTRSQPYQQGAENVYLIKTDSLGDTLWTKTYGTANREIARWGCPTLNDGYIVVGSKGIYIDDERSTSDIYLLRTDSSGDTIWTKTYDIAQNDYGRFVQQTSDGGYIVLGNFFGSGVGSEIYLMKTDSLGDTLWTKTYGGSEDDYADALIQDYIGGYILAGYTESYGAGDFDAYLIRTDSVGDTLETKTYGGAYDDRGISIQKTSDNDYILAGFTYSYGAGSADFWFMRLSNGLISDDSLALAYNGNRHLARQPNTGNMHLVYTSSGNIVYVSSTNYGVDWTLPYTLGMGEFPAVALTPLGKPCVSWTHGDTLWFSKKDTTWSSTSYLFVGATPYHSAITVTTPDQWDIDTVHIVARVYNSFFNDNRIKEVSFPFPTPSTSVKRDIEVGGSITLDFPSIAGDYNGTLHTTWMHGDTVYYGTRDEDSSWNVWGRQFDSVGVNSAHPFSETYGDSVFVVWQNEGDDEVWRASRYLPQSFSWSKLSQTASTPSTYPVNASGMVSTFVDKSTTSDSTDIFWKYDSGGSLHNISSTSTIKSLYPQTNLQILSPPPHYQYTAWQEGNSSSFIIEFEKVTINPRPAPAYFISINGTETPSLHLVERDTFISDWQIPVDIGYDDIAYEFPLDPGYRYKLKVIAYHESSGEWREWVTIDNSIHQLLKYKASEPETLECWIPQATYQDSLIEVSLVPIIGDYATAGPIFIYRYEQEETESAGGSATGIANQKECKPSMGITSLLLSPNPFNKNLNIEFHAPISHNISIRVYDVTGRLVKNVFQGGSDGTMKLQWDNTDEENRSVSQGIYFMQIRNLDTDEFVCKKIIKLR